MKGCLLVMAEKRMKLRSTLIPIECTHRLNKIVDLLRYLCVVLFMCSWISISFAQPKTGAPAPEFKLKDQAGKLHSLDQYRGKIVVLEWTNPTCPFVVKHYDKKTMTQLAAAHPDVIWLTINSSHYTTDAKNTAWAKKEGVRYVLNDAQGDVGKRYGARTTPHMYVIDAQGILVYQGAIDDNPYFDRRQDVNYVAQALQDLAAKRPVRQSETQPYGCSVKYKR